MGCYKKLKRKEKRKYSENKSCSWELKTDSRNKRYLEELEDKVEEL